MEYTVETLAKLSGVSVRTLHYYDEIGLLKPLARMEGGKRYYGSQELLMLLEILYFKEVGFNLKKIKSILENKNINKASLLYTQKQVLEKEIIRLQKIIQSIDKTIGHHKGKKMSEKQITEQFTNFFDLEKILEKEFGNEVMEDARRKAANMTPEENRAVLEWAMNFNKKIITAIEANVSPDSKEVQELILDHYNITYKNDDQMDKEKYLKSRDYLLPNSPIYPVYEKIHPQFPEFFYKAMTVFAGNHFSKK